MDLWIVWLLIAGLVVAATAREIVRDGWGRRPPPRSHRDWEAYGLPSRPYAELDR